MRRTLRKRVGKLEERVDLLFRRQACGHEKTEFGWRLLGQYPQEKCVYCGAVVRRSTTNEEYLAAKAQRLKEKLDVVKTELKKCRP